MATAIPLVIELLSQPGGPTRTALELALALLRRELELAER